jgi:sodium/potassium-transporting ATPase subunit alpha
VAEKRGLDKPMAARRLANNGRNIISPPPRNLARKIFFYIFGGERRYC